MKILVLNGSPKNDKSVTLQSVKYLAKMFTEDEFVTVNVAAKLGAYRKGEELSALKNAIDNSEIVLASYPVYTFLATAQLHEFFEIMHRNEMSFGGKYVTQITTSKHFYDVTAHGTVKKIMMTLGGRHIDSLSEDMEDLTKEQGRKELVAWWNRVKFCVKNGVFDSKSETLEEIKGIYTPRKACVDKLGGKKVLILSEKGKESLNNMVEDFRAVLPYESEVLYIEDLGIKNGCLGCLKCTLHGHCAIKDGFENILNDKINKFDAHIMAFEIKLHGISAEYKKFFDRQFVNGHRPVTSGAPTGYIVSGDLEKEDVLKMYLDAKSAVGGNPNCGIVCDTSNPGEEIDKLAKSLTYALENNLQPTSNFYDKGGMCIFRDMIWIMRGLMRDDYKYFKKNKLLDMPHKQKMKMLGIKILGWVARNRAINKKMPNMMSDGMLMMYEKYTK